MYLNAVLSFAALAALVVAAPTKGCGSAPPASGTYMMGLRKYILHIPAGYNKNTPSPLIMMHAGFGQSSEDSVGFSHYANDNVNPDYISVFPQGSGANKTENWQGEFPYPTVNDIKFIGSLLTQLENTLCLDDTRLYASGFSNGGGWTNSIACNPTLGPRFAAFGINSGAYWYGSENLGRTKPAPSGTGCKPGRAVTPILEIHGFADPRINYTGNEPSGKPDNGMVNPVYPAQYTGVQEWLGRWAKRNGCGTVIRTSQSGGDVIFQHYNGNCSLEHYRINDLKHQWANANNNAAGLQAVLKFLDFFGRFTL